MYLTGCLRSPEVKPAGSVWLSSTRSRQRARPATFVSEIGLKMFCRDSPPLRPVSLFLCCRRSGNLPQNNFFNSRSAFVRKAPDMYLTGWIKPVTHAYYGSAENMPVFRPFYVSADKKLSVQLDSFCLSFCFGTLIFPILFVRNAQGSSL